MISVRLPLVASVVLFTGCASFHPGPEISAAPQQNKLRQQLQGKTVKVEVDAVISGVTAPKKCRELEPLKSSINAWTKELGLIESNAAQTDYRFKAFISRCTEFDDATAGNGWGVMYWALHGLTLLTVPFVYSEDLQVQLTIHKANTEIYKGSTGDKGYVATGWPLIPFMFTNSYGFHDAGRINNILAKQLIEIEEQGVFE